jgi:hypothetical protein
MMDSKKTNHIFISCGVMLLVACLVIGILFASGLIAVLSGQIELGEFNKATPTQDLDASPTFPSILSDDSPSETQTETLEDLQTLSPDLAKVLTNIESEVMRIRELSSSEPVEKTLISEEDLQEIVINDFFSDYSDEEAQKDVLALSILGLLPKGFDLKGLYQALYSEQIAGFYDDETKEIYVVQGTSFGGNEKLTYAHEYTHVLQDQVYGLQDGLGYTDEACETDSERCAAIHSLIEGDASLTEILWFQNYATRKDYNDLMEAYDNFKSPVLDSAPAYLAADLYFPYEKGLTFVQNLYDDGGFAAVDNAYQNLPVSTEQILHPEKYPEDQPQFVSLPDLASALGEEWSVYDQNIMGEWYTFLILNKPYNEAHRIPEHMAVEAAEGWGGDTYAFYLNNSTGEAIFVLESVWDTLEDAEEFEEAIKLYANLRWEKSENAIQGFPTWADSSNSIVFLRDGAQTLWLFAPSDTLIETLLLELR